MLYQYRVKKGKPIQTLSNFDSHILITFSKFIGIKDSNEAEILAILKALRLQVGSFLEPLIIERD